VTNPEFLDLEDVLLIHEEQLARYGGSAGLVYGGLAETLRQLARPWAGARRRRRSRPSVRLTFPHLSSKASCAHARTDRLVSGYRVGLLAGSGGWWPNVSMAWLDRKAPARSGPALAALTALLLLGHAAAASAADWEHSRRITGAGTRSEGRVGTLLYKGAPVSSKLRSIATAEGAWEFVVSAVPWGAHGWAPVAHARVPSPSTLLGPDGRDGGADRPGDDGAGKKSPGGFAYAETIANEGTKSAGVRGILSYDGVPLRGFPGRIRTPIGSFWWVESERLWEAQGWFPTADIAVASVPEPITAAALATGSYRGALRLGTPKDWCYLPERDTWSDPKKLTR